MAIEFQFSIVGKVTERGRAWLSKDNEMVITYVIETMPNSVALKVKFIGALAERAKKRLRKGYVIDLTGMFLSQDELIAVDFDYYESEFSSSFETEVSSLKQASAILNPELKK